MANAPETLEMRVANLEDTLYRSLHHEYLTKVTNRVVQAGSVGTAIAGFTLTENPRYFIPAATTVVVLKGAQWGLNNWYREKIQKTVGELQRLRNFTEGPSVRQ